MSSALKPGQLKLMHLLDGNSNCPYTAEIEATQEHRMSSFP